MAWEDGNPNSIDALLEAAAATSSKDTKERTLQQALASARCIKDERTKKNYVKLVEDKLDALKK